MKQFLFSAAGAFAGIFLFAILALFIIPVMIVSAISSSIGEPELAAPVGDSVVVELDLRLPRLDQPVYSPFPANRTNSLIGLVETLQGAASDDDVQAVIIRANEIGMPAAHAEEIRAAIQTLKDAGKPVYVHSQGFYSTSVVPYAAIAAADEIWLSPTAPFMSAGLASETPFYGGAIEQFGAQAQFLKIDEYKTSPNAFTETDFTDAHREATTSLLNSLYDNAVSSVAGGMERTPDEVRALFDNGPYLADAAVEAGLVDALGRIEELRQTIGDTLEGARIVAIEDYAESRARAWSSGPEIALVSGQGAIVTGDTIDATGPFGGGDFMGSDTIARAIDDAAASSAQAIVFRVDSPGGNVVASDQIWKAVERAREAGKPVIISMGSIAASGGYYVSMGADHIVANESTVTGSIGIYMGKLVIDGTLDRIGVNIEPLTVGGEFAGALSAQRAFTDTQEAALRADLERNYQLFIDKAAEGRGLTPEAVDAIARGRVWTGAQALDNGLVDETGGLTTAIAAAKRLAGIDADANITLTRFPARLTGWEAFRQFFGTGAETAQTLALINELASSPEARAILKARAEADQAGRVQARSPELELR